MHFPELWEEDSLLFDDTAERELLLRQFEELIGEISSDEGYEKDPFPFLQNEKGKVKDTRDILELPTLFSTPPTHQHHGLRDWQLDSTEAFTRKLLAECDQGMSIQGNGHQQTRRYDVPLDLGEKLSPLDNHQVQGSPLKTENSPNQPAGLGMLSRMDSPNPDVVGIVKLPDGNYYIAMSESSKRGPRDNDCTKKMMSSMTTPSKSVEVSRSGPSISPSLESLSHLESAKISHSDGQTGRFMPKKLFSSDKVSRKNNATRTPRKRARTYPYQPNPPKVSPPPSNGIPQDIMKDLAVIRIHRRSSYADGDSLVEVQPSSLPGSPTMFAYRDPEGRIRVPLDMHCNQKALATYRCMTPSKTAATKIVSVCDMTQRLPIPTKGTVQEKTLFADAGSQRVGSTQGPEVIHQLMTSEETDHGVKEGSLSTQTIMKEWEQLRQQI
eukprot:XP_011665413.1 PREDICTED: uncharacterized protein LOC105438816 [Strongylocentrotus purpuratus]